MLPNDEKFTGQIMTSEKRPWGEYSVLYAGPDYQVKRVQVSPGLRLSLQKHAKRVEKWTIVSGSGQASVGDQFIAAHPGVVIDIPVGEIHRIHNTGKEPLVFIEVQFGTYLGEDDIVRLEDDYGRK